MFIKGDWYLTVDMTDETSLQSVSVKKGDSDLTAGTDYYLTEQVKEDGGPARRTLIHLHGSLLRYSAALVHATALMLT